MVEVGTETVYRRIARQTSPVTVAADEVPDTVESFGGRCSNGLNLGISTIPGASMSDGIHSYEPRAGHGLRHDPFNSIVGPRPIGWISTIDREGRRNLAPYSFFNAFCYHPPIVGFSSTSYKDTVSNIDATREFVWNLATKPLAEAMNASCAAVPHDTDEFVLAGLTPGPSLKIGAPRVLESPVSFECRVTEIHRLLDAEGRATESWMTFGEVVAVHIDRRLIRDGIYVTAAAEPILRGGGPGDYFEIKDDQKFVMARPR